MGLYIEQVEEAEEAILVAEEAQLWEGERQFYFTWDPIRYYQHLDTYEVVAREAKELECPLFRLFEEDRELSNPTPEEILADEPLLGISLIRRLEVARTLRIMKAR